MKITDAILLQSYYVAISIRHANSRAGAAIPALQRVMALQKHHLKDIKQLSMRTNALSGNRYQRSFEATSHQISIEIQENGLGFIMACCINP